MRTRKTVFTALLLALMLFCNIISRKHAVVTPPGSDLLFPQVNGMPVAKQHILQPYIRQQK